MFLLCVALFSCFVQIVPRLVAFGLFVAALQALRLQPRKSIDISWRHLLASLRYCFFKGKESGARVQADIERQWSPKRSDAMVFLAVRTGMDVLFEAMDLPQGSEVLFWPGVTIPAIVDILQARGLRPRGADPASVTSVRVEDDLDKLLTAETKVIMITHLFGAVEDARPVMRKAKARGIFVIEDCAQAFIGAAADSQRFGAGHADGFSGSEEADATFVSFGLMKTLTALGGAVATVSDAGLRKRMFEIQKSFPARPESQFVKMTLKAFLLKIILRPCLWGLLATICAVIGIDLDKVIINGVRGFPDKNSFRLKPSLPLLRLLRRRLRFQHEASLGAGASSVSSTLKQRRDAAASVAEQLTAAGVEVVSNSTALHGWWLLPIVDKDPQSTVRGLWRRGFDATCTSTQLKAVSSMCKQEKGMASKMMDNLVYLPLSDSLSADASKAMVAAVLDVRSRRHGNSGKSTQLLLHRGARRALCALIFAVALAWRPTAFIWLLPSTRIIAMLVFAGVVGSAVFVVVARWLASTPELRVQPELLRGLNPKPRVEGLEYCKGLSISERIDGAIVITGATGFVGSTILFMLLARARDLGISRIVAIIRKKANLSAQDRLAELRNNAVFDEVRDMFDELVVAIEGDVTQQDLGWGERFSRWPYEEPLRALLHVAADVRFDKPLQQAAVSHITASLQAAQVAARWGAKRFLFVSTAFVHAVPSASTCLQERLVELRDFDAMELYRDMVTDGRWAAKAMRELGFPNTYTFTKAVAEHLVLQACAEAKLDARIVRPSIVGPAWAAPFAGWSGDQPSTVIAAAMLLQRRVVRVFASSDHPAPIVPVDLVAEATVKTLVAPRRPGGKTIMNATVDVTEAERVPSFRSLNTNLFRILALSGQMPLAEAGLLMCILKWAQKESTFWFLDAIFNAFPMAVLSMLCTVGEHVPGAWSKHIRIARLMISYSRLPAIYHAFSAPSTPWRFSSSVRLPKDFDTLTYVLVMARGAESFRLRDFDGGKSSTRDLVNRAFREVTMKPHKLLWLDWLLTLSTPGMPLPLCAAAFAVRRVLGWMDVSVTVDAASLVSVTQLAMPLVFCPTHRSLLDFVILGTTCFQLHPLIPVLQLPHVAADAEFSGLPILGRILVGLGAFFVRRGGGSVQPDPALRAEVGRVFRNSRPMEVFLEGLRSRGRRHLRLRTGLLRALRDVSQRTVALVPTALSYELLPEDQGFYDELQGRSRPPLSTLGLCRWVLRGLQGDLPSYGEAYVKLGRACVLDIDSDLPELLSEVQEQQVELTSVTKLHARALGELFGLSEEQVLGALAKHGCPARSSCLPEGIALTHAERWALALQAATKLRSELPACWAAWLVEPVRNTSASAVDETDVLGAATCVDMTLADEEDLLGAGTCQTTDGMQQEPADAAAPAAESSAVVEVVLQTLNAAEAAARAVAAALRANGVEHLTEEHLLQQLLQPQAGHKALAPPLAQGAVRIVAGPLGLGAKEASEGPREGPSVVPLWPTAHKAVKQGNNDAALERWGFKDTKFVAQWVDGRPAVQITSKRYGAIGGKPMFKLWSFFEKELATKLNVRGTMPEQPLPQLAPAAEGLAEKLLTVLPEDRIRTDNESRLRAGTGHGLTDIWRLRTSDLLRMPDAVVRPHSEEEVLALLRAAAGPGGFAVIPVGGRTNVTSATVCPSKDVDSRPFVALDMRGMSRVQWVNKADGVACIEAGITGSALKDELRRQGVNMGMEPDSMEFSTLGGWIATRASGMKRARYGNIEDMVIEVRVVTPAGVLWQHHGSTWNEAGATKTAIGRASTNVGLPGVVLGSEGCLGVFTAAIVRIQPLPEVVEYDSVVFAQWDAGASWMHQVAKLPAALRPASCRLMDSKQLRLARAIRDDPSKGQLWATLQSAALQLRGVDIETAAAATLVFEGSKDEVMLQKRVLHRLVRAAGGIWGGASSGEAGYAMTFAIAYLRDFGLDHQILSESLETFAPWSSIGNVWPAVVAAVEAEHRELRLPGQPFMSCRMTQLYDEGGVLYMYIAVSTVGLSHKSGLEAFNRLEHAARSAVLKEGGCLSHHHGVGKHRASLLPATQSSAITVAMHGLKTAVDPENILAARNGVWAATDAQHGPDQDLAADVAQGDLPRFRL